MTASGSMADHDLLVSRFTRWQEVERAYDAAPNPTAAADLAARCDAAFLLFKASAEVCGLPPDEPQPVQWVRARILSYGKLVGREREASEIAGERP